MIITQAQKEVLNEYIPNFNEDIDALLLDLDDKITEIGFEKDNELNEVGLKLQMLYDELYSQN